jgi:hypothetical protein
MRAGMAWLLWLAFGSGLAHAEADVALVNLVSGDVSFVPYAGQPGKVRSFMKVRDGDRFQLPSGAQLRIVYFEGARQELWRGPARFRAAKLQGNPLEGAPAHVQVLPAIVAQRIAGVPDLLQNARLGGVQVRGAAAGRRTSEAALAEARATYQDLRKQLPADDITAELFLFSALNDNQLYEEMAPLMDEMLRKQPQDADVRSLAAWLQARRRR